MSDQRPALAASMRRARQEHDEVRLFQLLAMHTPWFMLMDDDQPVLDVAGELDTAVIASQPELLSCARRDGRRFVEVDLAGALANLPQACGISVRPCSDAAWTFDADGRRNITDAAAALAITAALEGIGGTADAVLHHRFVVVVDGDDRPARQSMSHMTTPGYRAAVLAFTSNAAYERHCAFHPRTERLARKRMTGRALCDGIDDMDDWAALWIDSHTGPNYETPPPLSPGAVAALLAGQHPRPEGNVLQARSMAELQLFLDQQGVAREGRTLTLATDEHLVVTGTVERGFSNVERSYRFAPLAEHGPRDDLGPGASMILCGGLLADLARSTLQLVGRVDVDDEFDARVARASLYTRGTEDDTRWCATTSESHDAHPQWRHVQPRLP